MYSSNLCSTTTGHTRKNTIPTERQLFIVETAMCNIIGLYKLKYN